MPQSVQISRGTMLGSLILVKQLGFQPKTVIDVGAALGTFELYQAFPQAKHFLIEPIAENEPYLAKICRKLGNAEYIIAAATHKSGIFNLHVNPALVHSSIFESEGNPPDHSIRTIPAITLDGICQERHLEGPYLIKVDVDGQEVNVLKGAAEIFQQTEYVIVEATLFGQIYDVIHFMQSQDFVIYDLVEASYRPSDQALSQVDIAFVKKSGQFRQETRYVSTPEQEAALNAHLKAYRERLIAYVDQTFAMEESPVIAPATPEPAALSTPQLESSSVGENCLVI